MAKSEKSIETREAIDAKVMADLIADPETSEHLRITIINKLLDTQESEDFFPTLMEENMSRGECPECGHDNHFLIPEDVLNKMGWVTHEKDPKVSEHTTEETCPQWQQSCRKKKISV